MSFSLPLYPPPFIRPFSSSFLFVFFLVPSHFPSATAWVGSSFLASRTDLHPGLSWSIPHSPASSPQLPTLPPSLLPALRKAESLTKPRGGRWVLAPGPPLSACAKACVAVTRAGGGGKGRERAREREGGRRPPGLLGSCALTLPAARRGAGRVQAAAAAAGGMESLLENPVRAVLYLKELTAIVQNQQSLIHTQRQRIDELERRLDELSAENRSLWEHQQLLQAQPPPGLVPPSTAPLPAPTTTAPAATAAQEALQDHGQLPPATPEPPLQHHGQLLAQPQPGPSSRAQAPQSPHQHSVVPGAVADKEKERPPSCCAAAGALLQHTSPAALGKGVLSRRPE